MSLINDMLRDLSHVQKTEQQTIHDQPQAAMHVDDQRELLNQSSVNKPSPNVVWPSLVVFLVVMGVLVVWKKNVGQSETVPAVEPQSIASVPVPAVSITQEPVAQESQAVKVATTPHEIVAQQNQEATRELNERLAALETAITKLSDTVQESNQATFASANEVAPGNNAIPEIVTDDAMDFVEQQESVRIRDPFNESQTYTADFDSDTMVSNNVDAENGISDEDKTPSGPLEPVADNSHLSIAPNLAYLDQRNAEQARELVAQGRVMDAVIALQTFIIKNKSPRESAKTLLDIYIDEKNIPAMEKLLSSANYLLPVDHHFYAAKAAILQEREDYAIELLESQLNNADSYENYRSLLAGLYQREGKYSEAANLYRRLLGNFGEKPAYWLGYALAQDSLNQTQTAKQAYLRVAQYSDLQPQVRSYIEQRLSVLQ